MGIPVDAHRAVGDDGPGVLAGTDHGRLHVNVPVQKARRDHLARSVDDAGALADAMGGALAHIGDAALRDGHVDVVLHFGRAHVHEPRARDHRVGGLAATAARVCVHSQSGFLQKWFSMGASFSAR